MITEAIAKIVDRHDLTHDEALGVMNEIMSGETTPVQTAAFLTALRTKGETVTEITACAEGMRAHALKFNHSLDLLEITGTGGTKAKSFKFPQPRQLSWPQAVLKLPSTATAQLHQNQVPLTALKRWALKSTCPLSSASSCWRAQISAFSLLRNITLL